MAARRGVRSLVVATMVVAGILLGTGASSASAEVDTVTGGQSALYVPLDNVRALGQENIFVVPIAPAYLSFVLPKPPAVNFPITGGTVDSDTFIGTVNHAGGMELQKQDPNTGAVQTALDVTNLRVVNGNSLIADTQGLLPAPTADLVNATHSEDASTGLLHYEADAQLNAVTATVLNAYFSTSVFQNGMILGHWVSDIQKQPVVPTGTYVRPKGATPLRVALVPAFEACTAPGSSHGAPLAFPSCDPPQQTSTRLTVGTPDANGQPANAGGFVRLATIAGNPSTSADEADVRLTATMTDVRRAGDLSDYTGELDARASIRLTDKVNGLTSSEAGTVSDFDLDFAVPCAATGDADEGAACSATTTADAVTPGMVPEGKRAIWQLGQLELLDGGADDMASTTADNTRFAVQGIFVP